MKKRYDFRRWDQWSLRRVDSSVSAANLASEFFASDNLMPKDVSQWDLCLVKEELWDRVLYEGKVQNTVILAEIIIRVFDDF